MLVGCKTMNPVVQSSSSIKWIQTPIHDC